MNWVAEQVGSKAIIYAGKKARVREAIQMLSNARRGAERQAHALQNAAGSWSSCSRARYEQKARGEVNR
jgi:hypothetical protein